MHREPRQVDVGAGHDDLLHRRALARDLDDLRLELQAAQQFLMETFRLDAEGAGDARAAGADRADELRALGPELLEPHRLGIAVEDRRHLGQVARLGMRVELVGPELGKEAAQAIAVEIEVGGGGQACPFAVSLALARA